LDPRGILLPPLQSLPLPRLDAGVAARVKAFAGSASAHIALGAQPGGLIATSLNRRRGKHRPKPAKCRRRQTHKAGNGGNRIRKKRKGSGFYVSFHAPA